MASASPFFIDLTDEPESPVQEVRATSQSQGSGSERPGNSEQNAQVIDLTEIDDDDGDVIISGSRALPPRRPWPSIGILNSDGDIENGGENDNSNSNSNSNSNENGSGRAPGGPLAGARTLFGLGRSFNGLQRLSQLTNMALDNIPTLGNSSSGSRNPRSHNNSHGGRSPAESFIRTTTQYANALRSANPSPRDVPAFNHFRAAPNPLGGNHPDLNYQINGGTAHIQQYMLAELHRHHLSDEIEAAFFLGDGAHHHHHPPPNFAQRRNRFGAGAGAYGGNGGAPPAARVDPNKPPYVAPPEPPAGFTRNMGEDTVAVCVGCDDELVYDPDQADKDKDGERPAKRRQNRKDREEHPFWGVTGCGHVYCRRCFDNRRNVLKASRPGQPPMDFKTDGRLVFCAAEGCQTDVTLKKAWVGLFV